MVANTVADSSTSGPNEVATDLNTAANPSASARRARKREQDRRCQRMLRERTKNRIAYLEGLLADFEREGSSAALHILRKERDEAVEDRDRLVQALRTINRVVRTSVPSLTTLPITDAASERQIAIQDGTHLKEVVKSGAERAYDTIRDEDDNGEVVEDDDDEERGTLTSSILKAGKPSQANTECLVTPADPVNNDMVGHTWSAMSLSSLPILGNVAYPANPTIDQATMSLFPSISSEGTCECSMQQPSEGMTPPNLWILANDILGQPIPWSHDISQMEDILAEDIPIRAIVEGWEAVAGSLGGILPRSWQQLRKVDEGLFFNCGATERLAVLRTMHAQLIARADTTMERRTRLPDWYTARPSQTLAHPPATDYFSWPGVRERFVFHPHRYCTNRFWTIFAGSFRILWPYEFRDCYTRSTQTGRYNISPTFQTRISDIRAFTMREDLFQNWPELRVDIPAFESIGRSITPAMPVPAPLQVVSRQSSSSRATRRHEQRRQNAAARQGHPAISVYGFGDMEKSFSTNVSEVELLGGEVVHTDAGSVPETFEMTSAFEGRGYHPPSWSA